MSGVVRLGEAGFVAAREEAAQVFIGVSAAEFVERFRNGDYHDDTPDLLTEALAFFPELD